MSIFQGRRKVGKKIKCCVATCPPSLQLIMIQKDVFVKCSQRNMVPSVPNKPEPIHPAPWEQQALHSLPHSLRSLQVPPKCTQSYSRIITYYWHTEFVFAQNTEGPGHPPGSGKPHELVSLCWCFVLAQTANLIACAQVSTSTSSLHVMNSPRPQDTACSVSITALSATRSTLPAGDRDQPSGVPSVRSWESSEQGAWAGHLFLHVNTVIAGGGGIFLLYF